MEELNWKYWYTDVDKDKNQYTYEECNRIGPVDAKYVKSSNKDFNGNPFIEALPRPRDGKELINAYTCPIPAVDMGELDDMTINEQKETVLSLKRLRLPLSFHKQLFDNIPQVIMHHPDPATNITQITYLVVSCMPNSNFATLYRQIGEAIDNALGYPEPVYELMITKKCRSLAEKQLKVCELIEKFSIGTIVLDEIQLINFNSNKENSYEGLLGIVNKTKIALSVVGTDEAYKKLFGMLRNARRAGEYINASAYTSDKEYFNFLLSMLLTWQWLDKPITKKQAQELSDTLYECTGGIINMLIWLYKWIMIEYLDNRSKGTIVIINKKFIKSVSKKHFGQLKGAIDMVNQAKVEEMEDEQILMLAESDKNKYEMPETNVENLAYESKMINIVIGKVHQIYTDVTSDDIARYVRQILAEDEYHRMKPTEVAKEVVAIITGNPTRKKRRPSSKAPASKNICDYISNA